MDGERLPIEDEDAEGVVRTFLIADVRGYTRFTQTYGDEAAAELAGRFARLTREVVTAGGGELIELRGDEALAVFTSPRQAVRTAVEVQRRLRGGDDPEEALPLGIGIGLDTGEAVPVEGGYRGKALNVAARLCSLAEPGQILATETVCSLAGSVPEVHLRPRKPVRVKGIEQPVRQWEVVPDAPLPALRPLEGATAGRSRRRILALAAGAVAVVVVAGIGVLALGGDSSAGSLPANSLGELDRSGGVKDVVDVGAGATDVVGGGGRLWVANELDRSLLRVDPATGKTLTLPLDGRPTALAYGDGAVWVLDAAGRRVLRVAADEQPRIVARYAVGNGGADVAFGANAVWVPNQLDGTVTRIDVDSEKSTTVGVGVEPVAAAFAGGALWVANAGGDNVARVDDDSNVTTYPVGHEPRAIAAGGNSVWVASVADGTVWEIDAASRVVRRTLPVGRAPSAVAVGEDVWVASEESGTVSRIRPGEDAHVRAIDGQPTALTTVGDRLWVTAGAPRASHRGGTLRLAGGFPITDQQLASFGAVVNPILGDGLVAYRATGGPSGATLVPDLATRIPEPTDEGRTYTFELRRGIKYSDGRPVKPTDFVSTFERLFKVSDIGFWFEALTGAQECIEHKPGCDVKRMVVADDDAMTVTFHLDRLDPGFLYKLAFPLAYVLPPDIPQRRLEVERYATTGPYRFKEVSGKRMVLERNPYFREWSRDAQPDGFPDEIVITPSKRALQQVVHDEADVLVDRIPAGEVRRLALRYPSRVQSVRSTRLLYLFLNTQVPPFDNQKARQAVAFAVDRRAVVNRIGGPLQNQVTCQVLPPNLLGYRPYCPSTVRPGTGVWSGPDLVRARKLVRESGTHGAHVTVWQPENEPHRSLAAELAATLRRLGYRVDTRTVPGVVFDYFEKVADPKTRAQAGPGSWGPDIPVPSDVVGPLFACEAPPNLSHVCDRALDGDVQQAAEEQGTEPDAAAAKWEAIDRQLTDAALIVPVAIEGHAELVSSRVGNYQQHPVWRAMFGQMWVR